MTNRDTSSDSDQIDWLIGQIKEVRPDLDTGGLAITGRVLRLAARIYTNRTQLLQPLGLTVGDFDVLATIRRAGEITATEIAAAVMITAGGTTKRLDRLEDRSLVTRTPDPDDRRSSLISLTPEGNMRVDGAYDLIMENESALITATLEPSELAPTSEALRALLRSTAHSTSQISKGPRG